MADLIPLPEGNSTNSGQSFSFSCAALRIIPNQFQEGFFPFPHHYSGKGRIFPEKILCIKRYLRSARPDWNIRHNLMKIPHQFFHEGNIPDITGHADHVRFFQINVLHDVILQLIDGVFLQNNMLFVLVGISLQIINSQIGMNVFGITCR